MGNKGNMLNPENEKKNNTRKIVKGLCLRQD